MKKIVLALTFVLVGSFMLAGCSKDEILNHYNNIVQSAGSIELTGAGRAELYMNLNKLIVKISDYICREEDVVRERLGVTMGGKVLELESERLKAKFRICPVGSYQYH
nr:hypothetical protein [uncultured Blautia sp.]